MPNINEIKYARETTDYGSALERHTSREDPDSRAPVLSSPTEHEGTHEMQLDHEILHCIASTAAVSCIHW